ncbi:MAG: thiol peroxidase [Chloroflexi bacterium AL-W]|nr:thiol peroxidase [Chloroflexi bacterium AL-N1]NOK71679.1 thiol peroxidase [Chloroflexi bacterium AL-N10]NOK79020.1 thiol peroxidase [Chloroflexi bacterium AL-N5]NOK86454.1 thiol peroxidase [Chloroflexi bacterium AL-W]NOK93420.1 thiol peroxidase [Chloroflexi bacterium AL-N15]
MERTGAFDFLGPRTLVGPELKPGDKAPAFTLISNKLQEVSSDSFAGKPMIISVVPSVDTSVCSVQTHRFDQEAAKLGDAINVVGVSVDLPFAQARWCGAEEVSNMQVLSDYRDVSFGDAYGTHIKDLRLESRAVFVVDADGVIRYAEYVPVAGQHPDYDAVLTAAKDLVR